MTESAEEPIFFYYGMTPKPMYRKRYLVQEPVNISLCNPSASDDLFHLRELSKCIQFPTESGLSQQHKKASFVPRIRAMDTSNLLTCLKNAGFWYYEVT